jgi:two-component system response regulator EvgA
MSKALIVDDHPFIRATVRYLLKQEGFTEIDEAGNGADAVQKAREGRPDLVILDLAIPNWWASWGSSCSWTSPP